MKEQILIVGAGPTGLVLALLLSRLEIPVRIIDKNIGPGQTSRAMAVHARTLELYHQLGLAEEVIAKGIIIENITVRKNGKVKASVELGHLAKEISPYPFVLSFPQDDHEKLLIEHLQKAGITVEWNTELLHFTQDKDLVSAKIKSKDKSETIITPFLLGCDGAGSTIRTQANIGFPGGTYSQLFYVADVFATGQVVNGSIQLCLNNQEFSLVFPIRSSQSIRLIGIVPKEKENKPNLEFNDIKPSAVSDTQLNISAMNWFSTYHSHHRVATHFKKDRVFLLGDAAHIHSPVGGQGMNTGIGDAFNLGWKIAAVLKKQINASLLDTYELERIRFARLLTHTTDQLFQAVTNEGILGNFIRNIFFPMIFPFFTRFSAVRRFLFNTVSQIKINYRHSPLSQGEAGKIKAGDRLPWVKFEKNDNFESLKSLQWQIHIYGKTSIEFKNSIQSLNLNVNEFVWNAMAKQVGLIENAVYLIRPDGYIAYIDLEQNSLALKKYLSRWQVISG